MAVGERRASNTAVLRASPETVCGCSVGLAEDAGSLKRRRSCEGCGLGMERRCVGVGLVGFVRFRLHAWRLLYSEMLLMFFGEEIRLKSREWKKSTRQLRRAL